MKCKSLLLLLTLFVYSGFQNLAAQRFTFPTANEGTKRTASQIFRHANVVSGPALPDTVKAWSYMWFTQKTSATNTWPKILSANTQVKMYVNHAHDYKVNQSYVYRMTYTLYGYKNYADSISNIRDIINDTLTIGYNPDSLTAYQDISVKSYPGYFKSMVVINSIYRIQPNGTPVAYTPYLYASGAPIDTNFIVEVNVGVQRYTRGKSTPSTMGLSASAAPSGDFLQVAWSAGAVVEPANYELEWTYVDNYAGGNNTGYDFRHNSSRIVTAGSSYMIPLVYQQGTLLYRVRMVRPDSVSLRTPIYGPWTLPDQGTISSASGKYTISSAHMGDAANWQYKISFAEEGKYKHVMSYFDGMLYNRQSITRFNSQPNKLLVTQNIYDYEGRPAITTLPAPTTTSAFTYQPYVALHAVNGQPYRAEFFDTVQRVACPAEPRIKGFSSASVSSKYYSSLNTDTGGFQKFVPDAGGFPFVQTIYAPGYDKRVERQGGAGDSLQIGMDHDTRYEYVTNDQLDLNRLFGLHAGKASFYHKTVSKDPNGQFSVSVKDYEGKQVMSALLGEVRDTISGQALMNNSELPADTMYYNDLMDGSSQKVVGLTRILDNSFFMDAGANDVLKYNFSMVPFKVCTSPILGLSVKAQYHCSVFDKCGTEVISKSGSVGVTGVIKKTSPVMDSILETAYLDKGKYTVHKELYINESDVDVAVDSFFHTSPTCLKTEDWFIRRETEATPFPCPAPDDECAKLRKEMLAELIPGGKYASFKTDATGQVAWDVAGQNSIFDKRTKNVNGATVQVYRYQLDCAAGRLNALQILLKGQTYTNLAAMSVRDFLDLYQNAGAKQYDIAEALLPTHPEYCKLSSCFVDTFETRLSSIPDAAAASSSGLLTMNDILAHDPLVTRLNTALSTVSTGYGDSLRILKNVGGIDTQALRMAYCGCNDSVVRTQCLNAFATPLAQLILPTVTEARNVYFKRLKELYLFNRNKYKDYLPGLGGDCQPCVGERMQLTPGPLVPTMYRPDGSIDLGNGSVMSLFSSNIRNQILGTYGGGSSGGGVSNDPDTLNKYADSAAIVVYRADTNLSSIQIDSIMGRMVNCPSFGTHAGTFKSILQNLISSGTVHFGQFTPEQVRSSLVAAGITLGDLCNPYLPSYDYADNLTASRYGCLNSKFYADAKDWLNGPVVSAALGTPTSTSISLSNGANLFEKEICSSLGIAMSQSVSLTSTFDATNHLYTLNLSTGSAQLDLFVRAGKNSPTSSTGNIFTDNGSRAGSFSRVVCIREQSAFSAEGYIGSFVFGGEIQRAGTGATETYACIGWNSEAFAVNSAQANVLGACVPCTEMKRLYSDFRDTMLAYSVLGTDHPLYERMLRSFMNYKLGHVFGGADYTNFIESCALADSAMIPQYLAYGYVTVPNAGTFASTLSSNGINLQTLLRYKTAGNSNENLLIDYAAVPFNKIATLNGLITGAGGKANTPPIAGANVAGWLVLPTDTAAIPASLASLFSFGTPQIDSVWTGARYEVYSRFVVTHSGLQPYQLSRNIDKIRQYVYRNGIQGLWLTRHLSTVNSDYYKTEKQDLLHYTYSLQKYPMSQVLDSLSPAVLMAKVPSMATAGLTYQLPGKASRLNHLYYTSGNSKLPGYYLAQNLINYGVGAFSRIFPAGKPDSVLVSLPGYFPGELKVFRCSDKAYWFRYFDGIDKMYNMYLSLPEYVPEGIYSTLSQAGNLEPAAGDTMSRSFEFAVMTTTLMPFKVTGRTDFDLSFSGALRDVFLTTDVNPASPLRSIGSSCEKERLTGAIYTGKVKYEEFMRQFRQDLKKNFMAYLEDSISEGLSMGYNDRRFNITLYRYDRAGNLIETIPPAGVSKLALAPASALNTVRTNNSYKTNVSPAQLPAHHKESRYYFNTLDRPMSETTPDGGNVEYTYDPAGRILFSQNDRQKAGNKFSYTIYDAQNRIVETGQVALNTFPDEKTNLAANANPVSVQAQLTGKLREDVVLTVYDNEVFNLGNISGLSTQENLRKRVSCVKAFESIGAAIPTTSATGYKHATYYSYDVAGNVKTLVQDFPELTAIGQQYKRADYEYDLWSGKVTGLSYNRGFGDQYFQRYAYDADNRIETAETSQDGIIWRQDASYAYYQHGPLARAKLGDLRVQNIDYAYTIGGWLKAINGDTLAPGLDMGRDGLTPHSTSDAYATTIDYFKGDYRPIGKTPVMTLPQTERSLYNGNIARQVNAIRPFTELVTNYTYDQLNRIRMANYAGITAPTSSTPLTVNPTAAYKSGYTYDMDGNLLKLLRKNAAGANLDSLDYYYNAALYNNRLQNVTDQVPTTSGGNDLPQMLSTTATPYLYDQTGRLIKDGVSRQDTIRWNIYNKVTQAINNVDKNRMFFGYDGAGNRVSKNVEHTTPAGRTEDREYYVRDASGNILAIYKNKREYKDSVISLLPYIIDRAYYLGLTDATYVNVLTAHYSFDPAFRQYVIDNSGVTASQQLSYYLALSPGTLPQMLQARSGQVAGPVIQYDINNSNNIVGAALDAMGRSGNGMMLWQTISMGLSGSNPEEADRLIGLMPGDLLNSAKMTLNIQPFFPPPTANQMLRDGLGNQNNLQNVMIQAQNNTQPTSIADWLGALAHDGAWSSPAFMGGNPSMTTEIALVNHANESTLYDFANTWSEGESSFEQVAGSGAKLDIEYSNNTNGFIGQAISMQGREWTYGAFSGITNFNPQDLAAQLAVQINTKVDQLMPMYQHITVLKQQEHYLAEHHLYGSSRLGIKNYFPRQVYSLWDYHNGASPIIDTLSLNVRNPWWSNALQGVINVGTTEPWNNLLNTKATAQAILGQKGYELTNHLGNVMAVVSDKRYEVDSSNTGIVWRSKPSLSAAYDYYPFGMLMPGRYVQGASDSCIFTTTTRWVPQWTQTYLNDWATVSPAGVTAAIVWNPGSGPNENNVLSVSYPGGGISAQLDVAPGVRQNILVPVQSSYGGPFRLTVTQGKGDDSLEIAYQILQGEGSYVVDFTPTTDNVRLNIIRVMGKNDGTTASVTLLSPRRWVLSYANQNQLVQICPMVKDEYRFGFNGQQKDNEYAGIGNHNTALFWEYDTRTGRRWNLDPVVNPSVSPYAVFDNNPISNNDKNGKTPTAVLGLIVGAVEAGIELGSQVVGNVGKGMTLKEAFKDVDYADVGLSFAEGFVDGTTLGASHFVIEGAFAAAKAGVDWKPGSSKADERFQMVGGEKLFGDSKYNKNMKDFGKDLIVEGIGIGMGKVFDGALGIGKSAYRSKALYKNRGVDEAIGRGILTNMFQVPTDITLDELMKDNQTIQLPGVTVHGSGDLGTTPNAEIRRVGNEIQRSSPQR